MARQCFAYRYGTFLAARPFGFEPSSTFMRICYIPCVPSHECYVFSSFPFVSGSGTVLVL